jgi:hypothetical protein
MPLDVYGKNLKRCPHCYRGYFGEIGHLFGLKTAGCPVKSATPI